MNLDRLSTLLRRAGMRGMTDKHQLMRHAGDTLDNIEGALAAAMVAFDRGDIIQVRSWLVNIADLLGSKYTVTNNDRTEKCGYNGKPELSENAS